MSLPPGLAKLLALTRTRPAAGLRTTIASPGFVVRLGAAAIETVRGMRQFLDLLGEVVLLLPRFVSGRARPSSRARAGPPAPGITTSVSRRWIGPA